MDEFLFNHTGGYQPVTHDEHVDMMGDVQASTLYEDVNKEMQNAPTVGVPVNDPSKKGEVLTNGEKVYFNPFPISNNEAQYWVQPVMNEYRLWNPQPVLKKNDPFSTVIGVELGPREHITKIDIGLCWTTFSSPFKQDKDRSVHSGLFPSTFTQFKNNSGCVSFSPIDIRHIDVLDRPQFVPVRIDDIRVCVENSDINVHQDKTVIPKPGEMSLYVSVKIYNLDNESEGIFRAFSNGISLGSAKKQLSQDAVDRTWISIDPPFEKYSFELISHGVGSMLPDVIVGGAYMSKKGAAESEMKKQRIIDTLSISDVCGNIHLSIGSELYICFDQLHGYCAQDMVKTIRLDQNWSPGYQATWFAGGNGIKFYVVPALEGLKLFRWDKFQTQAERRIKLREQLQAYVNGITIDITFTFDAKPPVMLSPKFKFCIGCQDCSDSSLITRFFSDDNVDVLLRKLIAARQIWDQSGFEFIAPAPVTPKTPVVIINNGCATTTTTPTVCGLKNLGNTCFMSSAIQLLAHCDTFLNMVEEDSFCRSNMIFVQLAGLLHELKIAKGGAAVAPRGFHDIVKKTVPKTFGNGFQHDAQEFLSWLLDNLTLNIAKPFVGSQKSVIVCPDCNHKTTKSDPCSILSLPIKGETLESCMKAYCTEEVLSDADMWICQNCNHSVRATKKIEMETLGPLFVVHLKRFLSVVQKIDTPVQFPTIFKNGTNDEYDLTGVIYHEGKRASFGHYFCVCLTGPQRWTEFNDDKIRHLNGIPPVKDAYVLLYQRRPR